MVISKKNITKIIVAVVLLVITLLSLNRFHSTECYGLGITIKDSTEVCFIDQNQVRDIVYKVNPQIVGYKMDSINIYHLKEALIDNPYIRKVSIYKTISGLLKIDVQQRKPIFMVINTKDSSYYVDNDGYIFRTNPNSHFKTIVVNGYVKDNFDFSGGKKYKVDLKTKTSSYKTTNELFKLVQLIQADDYWRDQIEQIYVNKLGEYELVPMVGAHILELGSIDDYDRKMHILKQFYFKAMNKVGWNSYKTISVKYRNQVVCTKIDKK